MRINHHTHRTIPGLALAAFTAATIAGCTMAPAPAVDEPAPSATVVDDDDAETLPDQPEGRFGKALTYPDGMRIKVGKPEQFDPPASAYADENTPYYVKFTVSITNDTDQRFDPVLTSVTVASGETEGSPIYDVSNGLSVTPTTSIPPGEVRSWVVAFGVTDVDDITAEVALNDLVHDAAMFTLR
jgi:hypothetical protein